MVGKLKSTYSFEIDHGNSVNIANQFDDEKFSDVCLLVGDNNSERIHAHRILLAANNPYFERLFYGNFPDGQKKEVKLMLEKSRSDDPERGVPHKHFRALLKTLYTNKFEGDKFNLADMIQILKLADMFEFAKVIPGLETGISDSINSENLMDIFKEMSSCENTLISDRLMKLLVEKVDLCLGMSDDKINCLPTEFVKEFLKSDGISTSEIELYKFVKKWLNGRTDADMCQFLSESIKMEKIHWRDLKGIESDGIIPWVKISEAKDAKLEMYENLIPKATSDDLLLEIFPADISDPNRLLKEKSVIAYIDNYIWTLKASWHSDYLKAYVSCDGCQFSRMPRCKAKIILNFSIMNDNVVAHLNSIYTIIKERDFSSDAGFIWEPQYCNKKKYFPTVGENFWGGRKFTFRVNIEVISKGV